jgi:hypothetical protein
MEKLGKWYNRKTRGVEAALNRYLKDGDEYALYQVLIPIIRAASVKYERDYSNYRISRHDFESAFMDGVSKLLERAKRGELDRRYPFLMTLYTNFKSRAIDVYRYQMGRNGDKPQIFGGSYEAVPIQTVDHTQDVKGVVIARLQVEEIFKSELSEMEREYLRFLYVHPDSSYSERAEFLNNLQPSKFAHKPQAKRFHQRLAAKLRKIVG